MSAIASTSVAEFLPLSGALALGPAEWNGLVRESCGPFGGWAWHQAWASAAPPDEVSASRALVVRDGLGRLSAVLPFRLFRTRYRRVPVTALGWAVGDLGCPDHLDLLAAPDADLDALVAALEPLSWDVLQLDNVAHCSPNADRLCAAAERRGWSVRRSVMWPCPYLALPDSWEEYLGSLTPTRRQTIRRKERNLGRGRTVTLTDYAPERVREGWRVLRDLHAQRWRGPGALGAPGMERLHCAFSSALEDGAAVWLVSLDLDGVPAAAWYGFALGDTVSFYQGGWDPRWERESIGAVLMGMMIRRAIERGYRVFDFLRGEEPYKLMWTSASRTCDQIAVSRRGWRGTAVRFLDALARQRERLVHA